MSMRIADSKRHEKGFVCVVGYTPIDTVGCVGMVALQLLFQKQATIAGVDFGNKNDIEHNVQLMKMSPVRYIKIPFQSLLSNLGL